MQTSQQREQSSEEKFFRQYQLTQLTEDNIKNIVLGGDMKLLNEFARELGKIFIHKLINKLNKNKEEKELTTAQIRSILDDIQSIDPSNTQNISRELQLLRPKLAYAAGRHQGRVKQFQSVVDYAIEIITSQDEEKMSQGFENLKAFVEAIVAYHRYYGGKE